MLKVTRPVLANQVSTINNIVALEHAEDPARHFDLSAETQTRIRESSKGYLTNKLVNHRNDDLPNLKTRLQASALDLATRVYPCAVRSVQDSCNEVMDALPVPQATLPASNVNTITTTPPPMSVSDDDIESLN